MLPQIESLLVIQDRDHQLQTLKNDLEKIPRDAAAIKERVMQATAELNTAKENVQQNELAIKKIDLDRKTRKDTIEKLTVQQFETSKNDEYAALGAEIVRYTDIVNELETQELEYMEKSDDLTVTLTTAEEKLPPESLNSQKSVLFLSKMWSQAHLLFMIACSQRKVMLQFPHFQIISVEVAT